MTTTSEAGSDLVFSQFQGTEKIFQWHGETFDIPHSASHLASSPLCRNQAFRYGSNVYGFQFHLEVDEPMIHRWLKVPENRQEIATLNGDIDPDRVHAETPQYISRLHELSNHTFGAFINLFGIQKTRQRLFSR